MVMVNETLEGIEVNTRVNTLRTILRYTSNSDQNILLQLIVLFLHASQRYHQDHQIYLNQYVML